MHNTQNPYQSTVHDINDPYDMDAVHYHTEPFYSFRGRIGRLRYLAYSILLGLAVGVIAIPVAGLLVGESDSILGILLILLLMPAMLYVSIVPSVRRLHDLNRTGWWWLLNLIPYVSIIFALYLTFAPGDEGVNDYGMPAEPPSTWVKIVALTPVVLAALGIIAAIALPMVYDGAM